IWLSASILFIICSIPTAQADGRSFCGARKESGPRTDKCFYREGYSMLKASRHIPLLSLLLPLCGAVPIAAHGAEAGTLNAAVARVLEREGVIAPGTSPSSRWLQLSAARAGKAQAADAPAAAPQ